MTEHLERIYYCGDSELLKACFDGNLDEVKKIIKSNSFINDEDTEPILLAAYRNHINVVKHLIENGFSPDDSDTNFDGHSALMIFIENNNINGVKLLLDNNCNIEHRNLAGQTALLLAVELGYINIVKKLIDHDANVNILDETYFSPLFIAISLKNKKIIKLLIESGANVNLITNDCNDIQISPLDYAHKVLSIKINNRLIISEEYLSIIKDLLKAGAKKVSKLSREQETFIGTKRSFETI